MPNDNRIIAEELANRPYKLELLQDETTDGNEIWVAEHPELPGLIAQGSTPTKALESLGEAKIEYILSLLEDGEPVPEPVPQPTLTGSSDLQVSTAASYVQLGQFGEGLILQFDLEAEHEEESKPSTAAQTDFYEPVLTEA